MEGEWKNTLLFSQQLQTRALKRVAQQSRSAGRRTIEDDPRSALVWLYEPELVIYEISYVKVVFCVRISKETWL